MDKIKTKFKFEQPILPNKVKYIGVTNFTFKNGKEYDVIPFPHKLNASEIRSYNGKNGMYFIMGDDGFKCYPLKSDFEVVE